MELEEYLVINIHGDNMAKLKCNCRQNVVVVGVVIRHREGTLPMGEFPEGEPFALFSSTFWANLPQPRHWAPVLH